MIPRPPCRPKSSEQWIIYRKKYGRAPNLCLIHPSELEKEKPKTGKLVLSGAEGVTVRPYRPVLPGRLWIGVEEEN